MKICGIYSITNLVNRKIYIGSSININKRKTQHFSNLKNNRHTNKYLQNAYNKYGKDNFAFEILEIVIDNDNLICCEQKWIYSTLCYNRKFGYNLCEIANKPSINRIYSKERREKQAKSVSGRNHYSFGKGFSEEHKQNLSLSHIGLPSNRSKKVDQFDLNGDFMKTWNSAREAAISLNLSPGNMSLVLNGIKSKRNYCGGYIWKFNNE